VCSLLNGMQANPVWASRSISQGMTRAAEHHANNQAWKEHQRFAGVSLASRPGRRIAYHMTPARQSSFASNPPRLGAGGYFANKAPEPRRDLSRLVLRRWPAILKAATLHEPRQLPS
jgi:hypothetical protein